jgi:hypothetical protein
MLLCPKVHYPCIHKTAREVGIHDADSSLCLETVLVSLTDHVTEAVHIGSFAGAKPILDKWAGRIVIGQRRINEIEIDLLKHEITNVVHLISAEIAPEITCFRIFTFEDIPRSQ